MPEQIFQQIQTQENILPSKSQNLRKFSSKTTLIHPKKFVLLLLFKQGKLVN